MLPASMLAAFMRGPSPERQRWLMGSTLVTYLADSGDTNGAFCLLEAVAKPGSEPPPHVHSREDELFYILEGDLDVFVGDDVFAASAGGCVFLPRLKPHAFIIRSPSLRMLALFTPGGIEEKFRSVSARVGDLVLPDTALPHPSTEHPDVVQSVGDGGVRFLTSDEIAVQLPAFHQMGIRPA
jgi:mannose-6-phosphate isomerase-like protein (cupin superfamily)